MLVIWARGYAFRGALAGRQGQSLGGGLEDTVSVEKWRSTFLTKGRAKKRPGGGNHVHVVVSLSRQGMVVQKDSWDIRQQKFEAKYGGP